MTIIWGDKVGLRPFEDYLTEEEVRRVYRWSTDPELLDFSGGTPTDLTFEEFRKRLRGERNEPKDHRRVFFIVTRSGELIGRVGCFAIDWETRQGELGIVIGENAYWGQGYGRDAVTTLLRHIFRTTTLERINLLTYPHNVRALKCFAASGFRTLGTVRRFSPDIGEFDGIEMTITRREFLDRPHATPTPFREAHR